MAIQSHTQDPRLKRWLWTTAPIAVLLALASGLGFFVEEIYARDALSFALQGIGQDLITLVLVVPVLVVSAILAARGSQGATLVWLGAIIYILYSYIIYAFFVTFNWLFPVYVLLLSLSLYALIYSLTLIDAAAIAERMSGRRSTKVMGVVLIIIAVLFYFMWLSEIVPAYFSNTIPQSILDTELPSSPVHIMDLAILLPGLLIMSSGLRKGKPIAFVLAPALLIFSVLLGAAIMGMAVFMAQGDAAASLPMIIIFGIITLGNAALTAWYLRDLSKA